MPGDIEVLAPAGSGDLGENPYTEIGQKGAHLLDVAAVARVDVDHRDRLAADRAQRAAAPAEVCDAGLVVLGG